MITQHLPDGTPYQIVERGDSPEPPHDADACGHCTFVADKSFIYYTAAQRDAAGVSLGKLIRWCWGAGDPEDTIIELGRFTLPGWHGHAMFYLLECRDCYEPFVDYTHGYHLYLKCPHCDVRRFVSQPRFFREAGLPQPPSFWQELGYLWRRRRGLRAQFEAVERERRDGVRVNRRAIVPVFERPDQVPDEIKRQDESHKGSC